MHCTHFNDKLIGCRNYSSVFIKESTNLHSSAMAEAICTNMLCIFSRNVVIST